MLKIALIIFAVLFFIVGLFRVVEFKAAGVSERARRFLIPLHVLGTLLLSGAMLVFAMDERQLQQKILLWLFFGGVGILCPLHIYVAIKRKIKISRNS
jgi:hypothetical protein